MTKADLLTTVLVAHPGAEMLGSDRMVLESVTGFVEAGARVVVALSSRGPLDVALRAAGAEVVVVPMFVLRKTLLTPRGLPVLLRTAIQGLWAGWRLLRTVRPDRVYVSTIIIPQWPVLARLRRITAISHIHEAESGGNRVINAVLYAPHRVSHRAIANSNYTLAAVRAAVPSLAKRATVILNGVASPDSVEQPRQNLDGPLRVLYVGRLSHRKGPDLVIDAAAALALSGTDVTVTLVGSVFEGYEWFETQLREQAAQANVPVVFAGHQTDVWPYLAGADVLVVPSRLDESFGNTAAEGVLACRPVIASDMSGLREAAGGYTTTYLVQPDSASAVEAALRSVVADWARLRAEVPASRVEAVRRHAPHTYRSAVAAAVLR